MKHTIHDQLSQKAPWEYSAAQLYDELTEHFRVPFANIDEYEVSFDFIPDTDAPIYQKEAPSRVLLETTLGVSIDSTRPWYIHIGVADEEDVLELHALEIPVHSTTEKTMLRLEKLSELFLPYVREDSGEPVFFDALPGDPDAVYGVSLDDTTRILADAGYSLPVLFTEPHDLQLHVSDVLSRADLWTRKESRFFTTDNENEIWHLLRTTTTRTANDFECDELCEATLCLEQNNQERDVVQIKFVVHNLEVQDPRILSWHESPSKNPQAIEQYEDTAVDYSNWHTIPATAPVLDLITENLRNVYPYYDSEEDESY